MTAGVNTIFSTNSYSGHHVDPRSAHAQTLLAKPCTLRPSTEPGTKNTLQDMKDTPAENTPSTALVFSCAGVLGVIVQCGDSNPGVYSDAKEHV